VPLVAPTIRTAAADAAGNLCLAFVVPFTSGYGRDGDKSRTVQFNAAGILAPSSLFFGRNNRVLVTPGLYEFEIGRPGRASMSTIDRNLPPPLAYLSPHLPHQPYLPPATP